jgi:hypothetical protein
VCVCVCVWVCEREREREIEGGGQQGVCGRLRNCDAQTEGY